MKFWKIKQFEGVEISKPERKYEEQSGNQNYKKQTKQKDNSIANDPFNEEENQINDFIKNEGIKKDNNRKIEKTNSKPTIAKNQQIQKPKKEDSDDDLAGWDN